MQDETTSQVEQDRTDRERAENEGMSANTTPSAAADSPLLPQELFGGANSQPSSRTVEPTAKRLPVGRPDHTDLERRVLAHERILQTLIVHMSETEPRFLERLTTTFCLPMEMARNEHDYTDTDAYAEAFVRELVERGESKGSKLSAPRKNPKPGKPVPPVGNTVGAALPELPPRIEVNRTGGVSHVTRNGRFYGDYFKAEDAADAASTARKHIVKSE